MRTRLIPALFLIACGGRTGTEWWNVGADEDNVTDPWASPEGEGEDEEADGPDGPEKLWWGEAQLVDGIPSTAATGYIEVDASLSVVCEIEYPLSDAIAANDCGPCTTAFTFTVGDEEFREGDGCDAAGVGALAGSTVGYGTDGETLYKKTGGSWVEAGFAEIEGSEWWWEEPLLEEE